MPFRCRCFRWTDVCRTVVGALDGPTVCRSVVGALDGPTVCRSVVGAFYILNCFTSTVCVRILLDSIAGSRRRWTRRRTVECSADSEETHPWPLTGGGTLCAATTFWTWTTTVGTCSPNSDTTSRRTFRGTSTKATRHCLGRHLFRQKNVLDADRLTAACVSFTEFEDVHVYKL